MKVRKYFRGLVLLLAVVMFPMNYLCKDTNIYAVTDEIYVNEQSGADTNDGSEGAPVKTIANAMTKVDANGVINIESDISIASTVNINKNVTIQGISGNEEITWVGNSFTRHFTITGGYGLTIRQLTINGDNIGGGINVSSGNLALIGVTLVNCSNNTNGGAIASTRGSNVNISDSIVQGNSVVHTDGYGGGIYSNAGTLVIQRSNILENTGDIGGAIGSYRNTNISIEDSTISNNIGVQSGGIYDYQTTDIVTLKNTVLGNNKATVTGGGIIVYDSKIELNGTISIESNKVEIDTGHAGGGIFLSKESKMKVQEAVIFQNNKAARNGGAIHTLDVADYDNLTTSDYQNIAIDANTSFEGNQANGIYKAPEIVNSYSNINYRTTSVLNHPINNYDINYENQAREVYSITYYNVDNTEGYKKEYTRKMIVISYLHDKKVGNFFVYWFTKNNILQICKKRIVFHLNLT